MCENSAGRSVSRCSLWFSSNSSAHSFCQPLLLSHSISVSRLGLHLFYQITNEDSRHFDQGSHNAYCSPHHPTRPTSAHSRSPCRSDCRHCSPLVVYRLDVRLPSVPPCLEFCSPSICLLAFRRFRLGRHQEDSWRNVEEERTRTRRRV